MMPWHIFAAITNWFRSVKHHLAQVGPPDHQALLVDQVRALLGLQVQRQDLLSLAEMDFAVSMTNVATLFALIHHSSPVLLQATDNKYCAVSSICHPWFRTKSVELPATTLRITIAATTSCTLSMKHCLPAAVELLQFSDAEMVSAMPVKDAVKMSATTSPALFVLLHPTLLSKSFATLVKHLECTPPATPRAMI